MEVIIEIFRQYRQYNVLWSNFRKMHETGTRLNDSWIRSQEGIPSMWWTFCYPKKNVSRSYPLLTKNPIITWQQKYVSLFSYSIRRSYCAFADLCAVINGCCGLCIWKFEYSILFVRDKSFVSGISYCGYNVLYYLMHLQQIQVHMCHANSNNFTCTYLLWLWTSAQTLPNMYSI